MKKPALGISMTLGLFAILSLSACGSSPASGTSNDAQNQQLGVLKSSFVLGKVGALGKAAAINLSKLIITGISSTTPPDTIRDTSTVSGNSQITVNKTFTLKPLRNWTLTAKTLDVKDSMIHTGSTSSFFVKPADTVEVSLNLTSRFAMYEARFNNLPDSVNSATVGTGKDAVKVKRVLLKVDNVIKADSSVITAYSGGQTVVIYFDYITPGSHVVLLEAYGTLNSYNGILYSGSTTVDVASGADDSKSISLAWQGPGTGGAKITVTLGKVGKVTINGALPGTILP